MKTLHFIVRIRAPREQVWSTMLEPEGYRQWTSAFGEGSYFEGSWATGQRIKFLGPGGGEGMTAIIADSRHPEFVSIKHLGTIAKGVEDTESEAVRRWAPAFENYTLVAEAEFTVLKVDVDVIPEIEQFMTDAWPKALALLKEQCERKAST